MLRMPQRGWWLSYCFCWALALLASPVRADDAPVPTSGAGAYDQQIEEAVRAYEAGRFAEARSAFRRAHELSPTARTLRTIGMCSFNLGDYADAVWHLESAQSDPRKPLTDEQRKHVAELSARATAHIGRFRLRLEPSGVALSVDGHPALVLGQSELLLEAGRHEISARAAGYQAVHSTLLVERGDRAALAFTLVPGEAAPAAPVASAVPLAPVSEARTEERAAKVPFTRTLSYVSLGLGAAAAVSFGVVSALALSQNGTLDDKCPDKRCAPELRDDVARYDTLRTVSTVSLISAGALLALGAVLLVATPAEHPPRARLEARLLPGALGLRGEL